MGTPPQDEPRYVWHAPDGLRARAATGLGCVQAGTEKLGVIEASYASAIIGVVDRPLFRRALSSGDTILNYCLAVLLVIVFAHGLIGPCCHPWSPAAKITPGEAVLIEKENTWRRGLIDLLVTRHAKSASLRCKMGHVSTRADQGAGPCVSDG